MERPELFRTRELSEVFSFFLLIWPSSCPSPSSVSSNSPSPNAAQTNLQKVGWTGPYPTLSRKRPTADLVSRKVLTPLLGQISLVVLSQLAISQTVQSQPWYVIIPIKSDWFQNGYSLSMQVSASPIGPRKKQYREFEEHGPVPVLLFPVHPDQHCP